MATIGGGYESPEDAALADWPAAAKAHIISLDVRGDRAEVIIDTDPSYPYWVYCVKIEGGWHESVTGNGPTEGWDTTDIVMWKC